MALLPVPSPVPYALVRAAASDTAIHSSSSQTSRTECSQYSLVARMTGQGVGATRNPWARTRPLDAAGVSTRCARGGVQGHRPVTPAPEVPADEGGESREAKPLWEGGLVANTRDSRQSWKSIDWQKNKTISAQSLFCRSCLKTTKQSHIL